MKRRKTRTALAQALFLMSEALHQHVVVRLEVRALGSSLHFAGDLHSVQELDEKGRVRFVGSGWSSLTHYPLLWV